MKNRSPFFRQLAVLTKRYFHIFFNDKQNLILTVAIPLLTILIVCLVASGDMFSIKPDEETEINNGYPVLNWQYVKQYEENDDTGEIELIEYEASKTNNWDGESWSIPVVTTEIDGEDYFMITQADQLAFLSKAVDLGYKEYLEYNYILQVNLNLKKHEWKPIGTKDNPFIGTFDGNGHTISNLVIDSDSNNVGLFGYVKSEAKKKTNVTINDTDMKFYHNGIIRNFRVNSPSVKTTGSNAGIIVGNASGHARITSVCATGGTLSTSGNNTGGIVGKVSGKKVHIYLCYCTADVKSSGKNCGGIVGDLDESSLSGVYYAEGTVTCKGKDSDDAKGFGSVVGTCEKTEEQTLNCMYLNDDPDDKDNDVFLGVNDKDEDGCVESVTESQLKRMATFLTPFTDIENEYDILNEEDEDDEENEDEEETYGFKQDGQIIVFGATQTGLFMLVCVAIFVGICNSIQEICKERNILKREYMTNLNLDSYVCSKLIVQACVCAVQMLFVLALFVLFTTKKALPDSGVFINMWVEYYISLFLLAFAADTLALLISSIVKVSSTANTFIPIILIVQIVFSGVLFEMKGIMDIVSNVMISKWGIAALAASTGLNNAQAVFLIKNPGLQLQFANAMNTVDKMYASTFSNILMIWGVLILFCIVCSVISRILLIRVKNDKR